MSDLNMVTYNPADYEGKTRILLRNLSKPHLNFSMIDVQAANLPGEIEGSAENEVTANTGGTKRKQNAKASEVPEEPPPKRARKIKQESATLVAKSAAASKARTGSTTNQSEEKILPVKKATKAASKTAPKKRLATAQKKRRASTGRSKQALPANEELLNETEATVVAAEESSEGAKSHEVPQDSQPAEDSEPLSFDSAHSAGEYIAIGNGQEQLHTPESSRIVDMRSTANETPAKEAADLVTQFQNNAAVLEVAEEPDAPTIMISPRSLRKPSTPIRSPKSDGDESAMLLSSPLSSVMSEGKLVELAEGSLLPEQMKTKADATSEQSTISQTQQLPSTVTTGQPIKANQATIPSQIQPRQSRSARNIKPPKLYVGFGPTPIFDETFLRDYIVYDTYHEKDETDEDAKEQVKEDEPEPKEETDESYARPMKTPTRPRKPKATAADSLVRDMVVGSSTRSLKRKPSMVQPGTGTSLKKPTKRLATLTGSNTVLVKARMTGDLKIILPVAGDKLDAIVSPRPKQARSKEAQRKVATNLEAPAVKRPSATRQKQGLPSPPRSQSDTAEDAEPMLDTDLDPALAALARKMSYRGPVASKPSARGQPEVWADSRQALCETVPYFKKPQGGCHQNDGHVYAFLFDNVGHSREYMDSDVIVARAGGSMEADSTGQMVQKKNHAMTEAQVQAVVNEIQLKNPVVIICGDKNQGALCKMPHKYNVLGWYKLIAVWAEKTLGNGKKTWTTIKYRFERLGSKDTWHAPHESTLTDADRDAAGELVRKKCSICRLSYPQVYLVGWMCLNADCEKLWKVDGRDPGTGKLLYNPAFLLDRTSWDVEKDPFSVKPPVPDVGNTVGDNLTYINTRGICCPNCGRCSSRRLFKGWKCDNSQCSYENFPKHIPVKMQMLHQPWETVGNGPSLARNKHEKGVNVSVSYILGFKVYTYTFHGIEGIFVHAVSNSEINGEPGGANEMFAAMQQQDESGMDFHLERRRFGIGRLSAKIEDATMQQQPTQSRFQDSSLSEILPGILEAARQEANATPSQLVTTPEAASKRAPSKSNLPPAATLYETTLPDLPEASESQVGKPGAEEDADDLPQNKQESKDGDFMTAFSINYGMPYKFVASGASLPFTGSPWPVTNCRGDLNWASQNFLDPLNHMDLNELLIFAYMEGQKIEYHDDGESGLGSRIATLSLGGKAKMHMRMKAKHHVGCSKTGLLTEERPVSGSIGGDEMYQKRLAAWEELQRIKETGDRALYLKRRKELPNELGIFEKRSKKAEDMVTITLNHGDIVLMEGYEIQKYLEHKVIPEQCLRFALTCRTVLPDHLKPEELPSYVVEPDEGARGCLRIIAARQQSQTPQA